MIRDVFTHKPANEPWSYFGTRLVLDAIPRSRLGLDVHGHLASEARRGWDQEHLGDRTTPGPNPRACLTLPWTTNPKPEGTGWEKGPERLPAGAHEFLAKPVNQISSSTSWQ